jgi:exodeoxyribonuclease VII large subunit
MLNERRQHLMDLEERMLERMKQLIQNRRQKLLLYDRIGQLMDARIRDQKNRLALIARGLEGRSPVKRLEAGFAYPESKDGKHLNSVKDLSIGQEFAIRMKDGRILAKAEEIEVMGEKESL